MRGFTLASVNPPMHVLPAQLAGYVRAHTHADLSMLCTTACSLKVASCHVVLQGGSSPSVYAHVHSILLCPREILCITPHS